jgi:hypothetical protein
MLAAVDLSLLLLLVLSSTQLMAQVALGFARSKAAWQAGCTHLFYPQRATRPAERPWTPSRTLATRAKGSPTTLK